mmetsp:Transcript_25787/g.41442  ORF Transcript_25787/g.41442 Transcript_25787/m.41442 type:complete len:430 (+) Transcript_25787:61-1350(+)
MDIDSMSVLDLRKELGERGLNTKGRKEELLRRLNEARQKDRINTSNETFELTTTRTSTLHEIRWEIDWHVLEQIKQSQDGEDNGEMLESAPCKIMSHDWGCYVEKFKEDKFLSFYVYGHDSAKASYSLYMKSSKTLEWKLDQDAGYYDGGWSRGWGWRCWKKVSQLKQNHVINGKIEIKVKLHIYNDIKHTCSKVLAAIPTAPKPELKSRNERMLNEKIHTDVTLKCQDVEIEAHKAILASSSEVFAAMFNHKMRESLDNAVEIGGLEPEVLTLLIKYIYTEELPEEYDEINLLLAADEYQIKRLSILCMQTLGRKLNAENVLDIMQTAHKLSHIPEAVSLKKMCMKLFANEAEEITSQKSFERFAGSNVSLTKELLLYMAPPRDSPSNAGGTSEEKTDCATASSSSSTKRRSNLKRRYNEIDTQYGSE